MMFLVHVLVYKSILLRGNWRSRNIFVSSIMFTKWIDINVCHFLIRLIKMTNYNTYPNLQPWDHAAEGPSAPSVAPQVPCHLSVIKAKRRGLINKEQMFKMFKMFKKKYEKYNKILNQFRWISACSSEISMATGISSVATFTTFTFIYICRDSCEHWVRYSISDWSDC